MKRRHIAAVLLFVMAQALFIQVSVSSTITLEMNPASSGSPGCFGVDAGDILIYDSHAGLRDKIIIDEFSDSAGYWECLGRILYWDSDISSWVERYDGGLAAQQPYAYHGISYEGYITPIPIDWNAQNESISGGIVDWSLPFAVEGRTMKITNPEDPTYSANLTYNENGVLTRFEELWDGEYEWWELVYYGHEQISMPGSSDFNITGSFNFKIQMQMSVTDSVNTTVEFLDENPVGVDFENGRFYIKIVCNDSTAVSFPVTLTVHYDETDLVRWGLDESRLQLYYFNDNGMFWENLIETVNTQENTINVQLSHFSVYSFGEGELAGGNDDIPGFNIAWLLLFSALGIHFVKRKNEF